MEDERQRQISQVYHEALLRAAPDRAAFVREACSGDVALQREVESLLALDSSAQNLLNTPAAVAAAKVMTAAPRVSLIGRQLSVYRVDSLLGVGGMGEVYRARDTKLGRDVAIKILPHAFTADRDRLARFEREARMLAALNHPHIGAIYAVEEIDGMPALVLELVEGLTLADRLAKGPIPIREALTIAQQISSALDAAHEKGIVHRDLKPGNIKITPDGAVKVLDFGLAKLTTVATTTLDLPQSPMVTVGDTREGVILGTAAYMSPEQARGLAVDKRTDIWAFGCVLYEMLTGRLAFPGETISDTIAAILDREPDWTALPSRLDPGLHRLLQRCLEKNPARRLRDVGDIRLELDELTAGTHVSSVSAPQPIWNRSRFAIVSVVATAVIGLGWAAGLIPVFSAPPREVRLEITTPPTRDVMSFAISPDGLQVVFAGDESPRAGLWIRDLSAGMPRFLPGTEGASLPFWSSDGQALGFFADSRLKRMDLKSGVVEVLADAPNPQGGTWGADGTVLFTPTQIAPVMRVRATGGEASPVTRIEKPQLGHLFPQLLPDGAHFLYVATGTTEVSGVYIARLGDAVSARLVTGATGAVLSSSGHLLFARDGILFAQAFNPHRLSLVRTPTRIADHVATDRSAVGGPPGAAVFASRAGPIVLRSSLSVGDRQLVWYDRAGRELARLGAPSAASSAPAVSPDGRQVALHRLVNGNRDVWLLDVGRNVMSRFTFDSSAEGFPVWTPDGSRIIFSSPRSGVLSLYQKSLTGGGEEPVLVTDQNINTCDVSPDGRWLLFSRADPKTLRDLWVLPLKAGGTPYPLLRTEAQDLNGQFAPNGIWVAFQSNESGRHEVSIRRFDGGGRVIQVSTSGGTQPRWRRDGREVFYLDLDGRMMSVPVMYSNNGRAVEVGTATPLFSTRVGGANTIQSEYVVSPDGQRFLLDTPIRDDSPPIEVILNWHPPS